MNNFYALLYSVFSSIGFIPLFIIILIISFYIFWRFSKVTDKNKNSIFDMWLFSCLGMIVWSRVSFIISNKDIFSRLFWFYLPYERYDNDIFLFRWLPWKYFAIWDKGVLFSGLIVGFLFVSILYTKVIKRWDWKEMLIPSVISGFTMISLTLFVNGVLITQNNIVGASIILLVIVMLFVIFTKKTSVIIMIFFTFVISLYTSYIFLSLPIENVDRINAYAIVFWFALSSLVLIFEDQIKKKVQEYENKLIQTRIEKVPVKNKAIKVKRK